jgi:CheY-like chemotaxis protein/HPt (histidine-containing phosphotransfer) domain-containing protein
MLSNLVSNAIKFTAQGSIRVEGAEVERGPSEALLEIAVTDSGIGISADKQFKLFQAFSQVDDSTTRAHGGTGLGLSIVRRLAQLMGGDVGVDSEVGKGSTFWFRARVMLVSEAEKSLQAPHLTPTLFPSATPSAATMHVLVVEDNPVNQKVIAAYLKKLAVQFEVVDNGQEAVSVIVGGGTPDLVLMDCQMPVMDGYEATRRIRQWELENARAPIAIIALTAGAFEEDRGLCFAAGMSDFLAKPVSMDKLIATLARWLPAKPNGSDSLPAGALDFAPSDGSLPDVPGFDVRSALARMDNDVAQYLEFLEIFRDGNAEEISGLAEAITRGDATEARRRAHSIKGSAGTIGAVKLQAAAAQLENGLKESQFDKELEAVVETEWQQVLASLAVLLRMPNAKAQTSKLDREKNDE